MRLSRHFSPMLLVCFLASAFNSQVLSADQPLDPIPLIFDTDIGNDVDDVLALGMIHALERRGECKLLAVTITKDNPLAAPFTDAVNTFYGRGNVPIGVCRSGVTPADGKFNPLAQLQDDGQQRYPHDLRSGKTAPSAVSVLRRALAESADQSVVIAQVGFSTNLAELLDSQPDDLSPLDGEQLVAKKVKLLSVMAGAFRQLPGKDGTPYDHKEYNVIKDIASAQKLAERWPTEIVWSGFEIGIAVPYPHQSIEQDYRYASNHPLKDAYFAYNPPPHDRPTWDLTSVLYAVRPDREYFGLSPSGTVTVADDGLTTHTASESGRHRYLTLNDKQIATVTATLVSLASEPPGNQGN